ncbi:GTPase Era [Syntrophomonas wolfei]|uniref:GTPase Era n=1 Tax=Syntrophomonas wolfei subsp. wolfei (strain DSM 2245B / Goettingen) TaxID=335541 RepID=Q0AWP0_SYNWW|nr:GTPase Era [Syntrophomonas wolfei]ABI68864.1 GTP-binding protein Era, Era/TrmE family [Syntrophomonas wolfei subsp. wolfei str. Goettingen G311]
MKSGFVSIVGRPNVGKSTLLNTIIGEKIAIVSEKPQTTRTRIQGIYTCERGQVIFVDTPGIHKPKHLLGEYMVKVSARSLEEVDIIYYMTDVTRPFGGGESFILEQLKDARVPVFLLVNKIDLVSEQEVKDYIQIFNQQRSFSEVVSISAACGTNLQLLIDKTLDALPEGPLYYPEDDLTDQPIYLLIAELIREKALMLTRDEVPHSLAVEVEEFKKQSNGKVYVRAAIYMERDSQKGILIGKKGQMLKTIGEQARQDIESLLDTAVYLDLWVKVKKNWRDNEGTLNQLGYRM